MSRVFNRVGVNKPGKSVFNLSYEKIFSGYMGYLYPSMVDEVVPGDVFSVAKRITCRMMPLVAPIMHEVNLYEHTFFVPYRLLMTEELGDDGDFEDMIIGGATYAGGDLSEIDIPTTSVGGGTIGGLADYLGFPPIGGPALGAQPVSFPFRAYAQIFNEYYRDVDLDPEVDITTASTLQQRRWNKDYFTSARNFQQRGTPPALPLTGTIDITPAGSGVAYDGDSRPFFNVNGGNANLGMSVDTQMLKLGADDGIVGEGAVSFHTHTGLEVDLSQGAITADVSDLRLIFQTQRWMERNMRAGTRYKEVIKAHFGENVGDARLDRPEYLGGIKIPLITSEVLGTNQDNTVNDQGTMAGHGIGVGSKFVCKYRVREYGLIMSILSVMPKTIYSQGIQRQWRKDTMYDFYWPEFANLSEQAVLTSEIYATQVEATNDTVFGYQGRYNEMRVKENMVCGQLRYGGTLNHWTLAREFASAPTLDANFVKSRYTATFGGGIRNDVFAVTDEHNLIIRVGNIIKAVRPLPIMSNPGLVDHS